METADSRYTVPVSLHEKTDYQWMVTVKTDTGEETESETAAFRTGIFSREHLKAPLLPETPF